MIPLDQLNPEINFEIEQNLETNETPIKYLTSYWTEAQGSNGLVIKTVDIDPLAKSIKITV